MTAAAFVRLCVETSDKKGDAEYGNKQPPSCGCVLKLNTHICDNVAFYAAAFVRLCVETNDTNALNQMLNAAAFGRLCVETRAMKSEPICNARSRLRAAVC